ncbi:MAG: hypothetical protein ABIW46_06170, partial [Acidimicrobiales bacterium]
MSGRELAIHWNGRPTTAWLPDPLVGGDFSLSAGVVRRTEQAIAAVRRSGDHLPAGWEPLARLMLR